MNLTLSYFKFDMISMAAKFFLMLTWLLSSSTQIVNSINHPTSEYRAQSSFSNAPRIKPQRSPPQVYSHGSTYVEGVAGTRLVLHCPVEAPDRNDLFIEWSRDGVTFFEAGNILNPDPDERITVTTRGVLRFRPAAQQDSGTYTCHAINGFGTAYINVTLRVTLAPETKYNSFPESESDSTHRNSHAADEELLHEGSGLNAEETEEIESSPKMINPPASPLMRVQLGGEEWLPCAATGNPRPRIRWYHGGRIISGDEVRHKHVGRRKSSARLHLKMRDPSDSGNYTCVAHNTFGEVRLTFIVSVVASDKLVNYEDMNEWPEILSVEPRNGTVYFSTSISLQCRVKSRRPPQIEWLKLYSGPNAPRDSQEALRRQGLLLINGSYYEVIESHMMPQVGATYYSKIVLRHVTQQSSGVYFCMAANHMGVVQSRASIRVIVPGQESQQLIATISRSLEISASSQRSIWGYEMSATDTVLLVVATVAFLILMFLVFQRRSELAASVSNMNLYDRISKRRSRRREGDSSSSDGTHSASRLNATDCSLLFRNEKPADSSLLCHPYCASGPPSLPPEPSPPPMLSINTKRVCSYAEGELVPTPASNDSGNSWNATLSLPPSYSLSTRDFGMQTETAPSCSCHSAASMEVTHTKQPIYMNVNVNSDEDAAKPLTGSFC